MNHPLRVRLWVSAFIGLSFYGLWSLWQLPVRTIRIDGSALTVEQSTQLMQTFAPWQGRRFFQLDLNNWQQITSEMSWVKEASIRRQWPATIIIGVTPHRYLAHWYPEGVITTTGEYLNVTAPTPLPLTFEGPPGMQGVLFRQYQSLQARLSEEHFVMRRLTLEPRGAWTVTLKHDCLLKLGRRAHLERLERWLSVHKQVAELSTRSLAIIDLRYVNGLALQYE